MNSSALLTDQYELTMIDVARASGVADKECIFEVYTRALPPNRPFGVFAGLERLLDAVENLSFEQDEITWLSKKRIVSSDTLEWLERYKFSGSIFGHREGDIFFPNTPVLTIRTSFAEAVLLETLVLSCINFDSAIAGAAAQLVRLAMNRPVYEMGSRRAHEQAAVAAARAAYIAGFAATSNLAAGKMWQVPTIGTSGHALVLAHETEVEAFAAQVNRARGYTTTQDAGNGQVTLLIDTYDIPQAIRNAVNIAGKNLAAVRIDSGALPDIAHQVRRQLDSLGATQTKIILTGDLDEASIDAVKNAPVDALGVGTALVTGCGAPSAGFVYKPVASREKNSWRMLSKKSHNKTSIGGQKAVRRLLDPDGMILKEQIFISGPESINNAYVINAPEVTDASGAYWVTTEHMRDGKRLTRAATKEARAHHSATIASLPKDILELQCNMNSEWISLP